MSLNLKLSGIKLIALLFILMLTYLGEDIPFWILVGTSIPTILRFLKVKIKNRFINTYMMIMLTLTFMALGPRLNTEMALSFFLIIASCKILQSKDSRDFFITQLVLLTCIVGTGLFNNTISMAFFMSVGIILVVSLIGLEDIELPLGSSLVKSIINSLKAVLMATPIAVALFFFFPRFRSFIPSVGSNLKGKIGHNKQIQNDQISQLLRSSNISFRAKVSRKLKIKDLYWRGRVLSQTDGYNWQLFSAKIPSSPGQEAKSELQYDYEIKLEEDLYGDLFLLDYPTLVKSADVQIIPHQDDRLIYRFNSRNKLITYQASSRLESKLQTEISNLNHYLKLPKSLEKTPLKDIIQFNNTDSLAEIKTKLKKYFIDQDFVYSLNPGKMSSMQAFIDNKRGFCTHYASLTAIMLRLSNIPSRIVNGFQGGQYNRFSEYYVVRSNDAHAWVEVYLNKRWQRLDPTEMVAPDRILLGGENYFTPYPFSFIFDSENRNWILNSSLVIKYNEIKLYFDYIDMKFNQFLQDFNKSYQRRLARFLKLELYQFYLMAIWIPILFFFIYSLFISKKRNARSVPIIDKLLIEFKKELEKQSFILPDHVPIDKIEILITQKMKNKDLILEISRHFIDYKYREKKIDFKILKNKIKKINS